MTDELRQIALDLSSASMEVIEVLCDEASDAVVFREIYEANRSRPEVMNLLHRHENTPDDLTKELSESLQLPVPVREKKLIAHGDAEAERQKAKEKEETLFQKISKLTVGERVHLAMKGGKEVRSLLLKDSSKEVVKKVLDNPRMTESEVEMLAKSRTVMEDALRIISKKKEWMKNYTIMSGLVTNPKTPAGVAMQYVKMLTVKDLAMIGKNKNVSQAVRAEATKLLKVRKPR